MCVCGVLPLARVHSVLQSIRQPRIAHPVYARCWAKHQEYKDKDVVLGLWDFTTHREKSSLQYKMKSCWGEEYPERFQERNPVGWGGQRRGGVSLKKEEGAVFQSMGQGSDT